VRRRQGERRESKKRVPRFKHEGGGVMYWGCVTWHGPGPLVPIEGSLEGKTYGDILRDYIPQVKQHMLTPSPYIIEDRPNVHKTDYVLGIKKSLALRSLELPPNSPDLNILENVWSLWKDKVSKRHPRTLNQLREVGLQEWQNITANEIRVYISSMSSRIQAVICNNGEHTKY